MRAILLSTDWRFHTNKSKEKKTVDCVFILENSFATVKRKLKTSEHYRRMHTNENCNENYFLVLKSVTKAFEELTEWPKQFLRILLQQ